MAYCIHSPYPKKYLALSHPKTTDRSPSHRFYSVCLERLVVRQYIYSHSPKAKSPSISHDQYKLSDQVRSTTAALVSLLQCITRMLETNAFVVMYALDFSKAFDTVRHKTLMNKVASLPIPDFIHNWILNFLADRGHSTRHKGVTSTMADINASVIQGSALGPALYIINTVDLSHFMNRMLYLNTQMTRIC